MNQSLRSLTGRAGIGLRPEHYVEFIESRPSVGFIEAHSENYFGRGGKPLHFLALARRSHALSLHGVGLSVGSVDPLSEPYLQRLRELVDMLEPALVSDHLCWCSAGGIHANDLLPLPYTEEALSHVASRVQRVQERLGRGILLENVSSYLEYAQSAMPEWEFLAEVARRSGCGILLDVNNIFVSAHNHAFDPRAFLNGVPIGRVGQIHLAGHRDEGTHLLDTHDHPVCQGVWDLDAAAIQRFGGVATLIERDDDLPPLHELVAESARAAAIERQVVGAGRGV